MTMPKGWKPEDNRYMDGDYLAQFHQTKHGLEVDHYSMDGRRKYSDDGKPIERPIKKKVEPKIPPKMGTGTYELLLIVSIISMILLVALVSLMYESYLVAIGGIAAVGPLMMGFRAYMRANYDIRRAWDGCYRD